jgi:hypothetical protein
MEYLRHVTPAPSVAFHERAPDGTSPDALQSIDLTGEGEGEDDQEGGATESGRLRLWDGLGDRGPEPGRRARIDISYGKEEPGGGSEEQPPHRSPQMWRSGSLKSPQKPSMLRPVAAVAAPPTRVLMEPGTGSVSLVNSGGDAGTSDVEMEEVGKEAGGDLVGTSLA